jgi:hypothetical protein
MPAMRRGPLFLMQKVGLPRRVKDTIKPLLLLLLTRLILYCAAVAGLAVFEGDLGPGIPAMVGGSGLSPNSLPGLWVRWDSSYYLQIARAGYTGAGGDLGFMPLYPRLIGLLAGRSVSAGAWAGYIIANASFISALLVLYDTLQREYSKCLAWTALVTLVLFPTSLFCSAVYTEGLFLLLSVLVYRFTLGQRWAYAAVCVALASLTRVHGILLGALPLVALTGAGQVRRPGTVLGVAATSCLGLILYGGWLWVYHGTPVAFLLAQGSTMARSVTWPGLPLVHSAMVAVSGYGGFGANWYMRALSVWDSVAFGTAAICAVGVARWENRALAAYMVVAVLALSMSHGPFTLGAYAMSRYVLVLFPMHMVIARWLVEHPRARVPVWSLSALTLVFLTAWFSSGRWVA